MFTLNKTWTTAKSKSVSSPERKFSPPGLLGPLAEATPHTHKKKNGSEASACCRSSRESGRASKFYFPNNPENRIFTFKTTWSTEKSRSVSSPERTLSPPELLRP